MKFTNINTREVLGETKMEDDYTVMVIVIPSEQFEDIARSVDSWALIGDDNMSFDEANGLMTIIEHDHN